MNTHVNTKDTLPWYRYGMLWMVLGGPAVVVVASFITLYLAITRPDPVISEDYYQKGLEINRSPGSTPLATAPAMQARNHVATGEIPASTDIKP